ncbi:MAG TPA: hypothetical protein PLA71_00065 [Saccharofermentans sp.]|nr:hypothetical protein [Saccharofermentans sp.]
MKNAKQNAEPTKTELVSFIRKQLHTNRAWALRGLERIYLHQTEDEQMTAKTKYDNGIGFNGLDATFLSSIYEQSKTRRITDRQMAYVHKLMPKYAGQIYAISDKAKLVEIYKKGLSK